MIYDSTKNLKRYLGLTKNIDLAINYVLEHDLSTYEVGRYDVDGDNVYVMVQEYVTSAPDNTFWESHRKYLDLQLLLDGREDFGFADTANLKPNCEYNEEKDYILYNGVGNFITLNRNDFVIVWPDDAHLPQRALSVTSKVRKVVIKIKL